MAAASESAALWRQLHEKDLPVAEKIRAATELLDFSAGDQRTAVWLYEWLISGIGVLSKKSALPLTGIVLLCSLLDGLPTQYLLLPSTPLFLAQLRHSVDALGATESLLGKISQDELAEIVLAQVRLLQLLLSRSVCSFRPSVEQVLPLLSAAVGPIMQQAASDPDSKITGILLLLLAGVVRMLPRTLDHVTPKKAFKTVIDAFPSIADVLARAPQDVLTACQHVDVSADEVDDNLSPALGWPSLLTAFRSLLSTLAHPRQHEGYEALARLPPGSSKAEPEAEPAKKKRKGDESKGADEKGPSRGDAYQSTLFKCAVDLLSKANGRDGCVVILPLVLEDFISSYRLRSIALDAGSTKESGSAPQKRSAPEAETPRVPCEFWFFLQLCNALESAMKRTPEGPSKLGLESTPLVQCLVALWRLVRERGVFRPRDDPQKVQSQSLDLFCEQMLQRLASSAKRSATRDAPEWAGLEEVLSLDVSPIERRLDQVWLVIGDMCPKPLSAENTDGTGATSACMRLASEMVRTYARLSDLPSCLTALMTVFRDGPERRQACALGDAHFVKGLEAAALEVSTSAAPSQTVTVWESLLVDLESHCPDGEVKKRKKSEVMDVDNSSKNSWWSAKMLEHIVHGIRVQELFLDQYRGLLLRSFRVLKKAREMGDTSKHRLDGLLLALCGLGRRVTAWDIPPVLRIACSAAGEDAALLRKEVADGLASLVRPLAGDLEASQAMETWEPYIQASVQWLALSEQERLRGPDACKDKKGDAPHPSNVVAGLLKLALPAAQDEGKEDSLTTVLVAARLEARRAVCSWVVLLASQVDEMVAKDVDVDEDGCLQSLVRVLVPKPLPCWRHLGRVWEVEGTAEQSPAPELGKLWSQAAVIWAEQRDTLVERVALRVPILQRLADLTAEAASLSAGTGEREMERRCGALLGLISAILKILPLVGQAAPPQVAVAVLESIVSAARLACQGCKSAARSHGQSPARSLLIASLKCLVQLLAPTTSDGPGLHASVAAKAVDLLTGVDTGDALMATIATVLAGTALQGSSLLSACRAFSRLVRTLLQQRVSSWTSPMRDQWATNLVAQTMSCRGLAPVPKDGGKLKISLRNPTESLFAADPKDNLELEHSLRVLLEFIDSRGTGKESSSGSKLELMLCVNVSAVHRAPLAQMPKDISCTCAGLVLSVIARCIDWGSMGSVDGHNLLNIATSESKSASCSGVSCRGELVRMTTLLVRWLAAHQGECGEAFIQVSKGTHLMVNALCASWSEGDFDDFWKAWVSLVIDWTELPMWPDQQRDTPVSRTHCWDALCGPASTARERREHIVDALARRITTLAMRGVEVADSASLPPLLALLDSLASVLKNAPHKPQLRSAIAGTVVAAGHGLLALGSTGPKSRIFADSPDKYAAFHIAVAEVVKGLYVHLTASLHHASGQKARSEPHRRLADAESLLLGLAGHLAQVAVELRREAREAKMVSKATLSEVKFSEVNAMAYGLMSAVFMAVPQEGVRLPAWTKKPHIVVGVLKAMLNSVYTANRGTQAARIAGDVARLWEAYTHGGTRLVAGSAGRSGQSTYQAKIQRATKGFVIMIIAHALDRQRRWPGVDAAVRQSLRHLEPEAREEARPSEVSSWKEVVTVLEQGMVSLLASLEGSEHLKQTLYAGLRAPTDAMFKEINENYQKHGRYQGRA